MTGPASEIEPRPLRLLSYGRPFDIRIAGVKPIQSPRRVLLEGQPCFARGTESSDARFMAVLVRMAVVMSIMVVMVVRGGHGIGMVVVVVMVMVVRGGHHGRGSGLWDGKFGKTKKQLRNVNVSNRGPQVVVCCLCALKRVEHDYGKHEESRCTTCTEGRPLIQITPGRANLQACCSSFDPLLKVQL